MIIPHQSAIWLAASSKAISSSSLTTLPINIDNICVDDDSIEHWMYSSIAQQRIIWGSAIFGYARLHTRSSFHLPQTSSGSPPTHRLWMIVDIGSWATEMGLSCLLFFILFSIFLCTEAILSLISFIIFEFWAWLIA